MLCIARQSCEFVELRQSIHFRKISLILQLIGKGNRKYFVFDDFHKYMPPQLLEVIVFWRE